MVNPISDPDQSRIIHADRPPEDAGTRSARHIAYILIGLYGVLLAGVGCVAAFRTAATNSEWLDLFKSGFLILGGGLTTVLGYYFGSRGTQQAEESAQSARAEARSAMDAARAEEARAEEILARAAEDEAPTFGEAVPADESLVPPDQT